MSTVIHKFELDPFGSLYIDPNYVPLHIEGVGSKLFLWAEVDPDADRGPTPIFYIPTGAPVPEAAEYIGTGTILEQANEPDFPGTYEIVVHVYRPEITFSAIVQELFRPHQSVPVPDVYMPDESLPVSVDK